VQRRLVPLVRVDFPTQVCVHSHEIPDPPRGQRLPLFVLVSRRMQVVILEGMPEYAELNQLISAMIAGRKFSGRRPGAPPTQGKATLSPGGEPRDPAPGHGPLGHAW
jgi:hypothetical protein